MSYPIRRECISESLFSTLLYTGLELVILYALKTLRGDRFLIIKDEVTDVLSFYFVNAVFWPDTRDLL